MHVSVPVTDTLDVPTVMVDEERELVREHAYAGEGKVAPIIVRARIERTVTAISLSL